MIGELKSKNTRTVRKKKVVRLKIDIPYQEMSNREIGTEDAMEWLDFRVGKQIGLDITALGEQDYERLDGNGVEG